MTVGAVIKLLLDHTDNHKQFVAGTFGAFEGTAGNVYMQQKEFNTAVTKWREKGDKSGLIQTTVTLQAYGNLTNTEYEQIMGALDGVK